MQTVRNSFPLIDRETRFFKKTPSIVKKQTVLVTIPAVVAVEEEEQGAWPAARLSEWVERRRPGCHRICLRCKSSFGGA